MLTQQRFQKRDLWWVLALPVYEVLGTVRHEASHALIALLEGAKIERFVIFPSLLEGHYVGGYVLWSGSTDWVPMAAPYLGDLLTYVLCFVLCTRLSFRRHWVWVNCLILGLVSPLVNSGYQYIVTPLWRSGTDVEWLLHQLPPWAVHVYFGVTLTLYLLGLLAILLFPSHVLKGRTPRLLSRRNQLLVSRKGTILIVGGSGLLILGSLVVAIIGITSRLGATSGLSSSGSSLQVWSTLVDFQTDQGPLAEWILQHTSVLSDLANEARWLGEGSAFFLGLAALKRGLGSLVRGQVSASARTIRWLAILGLISTLSACVGQGTLALIDQVLGFPQPGGVLLQLVKMPFLLLGLIGFCGVLWGSFLRSKKVEQHGGTKAGEDPS